MDGQLKALIDTVDLARDERAIRGALKQFAAANGFDRFAYLHTLSTGVTAFSDYHAEWQSIYLSNAYSTIDPVVWKAKRTPHVFTWSADDRPARLRSTEERKFFSQAIDFGLRSGVTIPLEVSFGQTAMLTLATSKPKTDIRSLGTSQRAATALAYVHLKLSILGENFTGPATLRLSAQEAACLYWCSLGKYMPEIATIMGIEHRTVQYHLDNARDKLGAVNLPHAVRIAMKNKLLS
ncbi:MAG: autoinducer binding domain-containing protein [Pseudaminobacter sp.]